ncbi:hypothetical protein ACQP1G_07655 [Nocardia sp. CA-107356]|uniref:hypothetical protein n=1 Tax=Nocardia sp. CA-107356 TaxID=3239972 RepID=UPI003D92E201
MTTPAISSHSDSDHSTRQRNVAAYSNVIADRIQDEWATHVGAQRMRQLRDTSTRLREITDPYT